MDGWETVDGIRTGQRSGESLGQVVGARGVASSEEEGTQVICLGVVACSELSFLLGGGMHFIQHGKSSRHLSSQPCVQCVVGGGVSGCILTSFRACKGCH